MYNSVGYQFSQELSRVALDEPRQQQKQSERQISPVKLILS